eukprot:Sdes_comp20692_c0_seq1m16256
MIRKLIDNATPNVIRLSTAAYIAGIIARASYVGIDLVKSTLEVLVQWTLEYISSHDNRVNPSDINIHQYSVFYAVCQSILYIFCFRHRELLEQPNGIDYVLQLRFDRIIVCNLNPLKACLQPLVQEFTKITQQYEIVYCHSILKRNEKIAYGRNIVGGKNVLDHFFPFDPFELPQSRFYIDDIYRAWLPSQQIIEIDSEPESCERYTENDTESCDEESEFYDDPLLGLDTFLPFDLVSCFSQ